MNTMTGKSFKKLREKAGLSRKDAATALGVTANGVYFWESNRSFPRPELWDDLITLYEFDRSELITLAGGKDSPRVRRYLAKRQEQPERRGRRIYLRSKPGDIPHREPQTDRAHRQNPEQSDFLHRINDLERRVAKLQDSLEIVERIEALLEAWKQLINAPKSS
jgi:transcriptional regulator with XRE-family HTH domain